MRLATASQRLLPPLTSPFTLPRARSRARWRRRQHASAAPHRVLATSPHGATEVRALGDGPSRLARAAVHLAHSPIPSNYVSRRRWSSGWFGAPCPSPRVGDAPSTSVSDRRGATGRRCISCSAGAPAGPGPRCDGHYASASAVIRYASPVPDPRGNTLAFAFGMRSPEPALTRRRPGRGLSGARDTFRLQHEG